jgi:hypothetical protein
LRVAVGSVPVTVVAGAAGAEETRRSGQGLGGPR